MAVNGIGRPLEYTPELGEEICLKIATSNKGIVRLCKDNNHWPCHQTIHEWRIKIKDFGDMYTKAKVDQVELLVDECIDIADNTDKDDIINDAGNVVCNTEYVNRSRLRLDTRKWLAAKLAPRLYGDKIQQDTNVIVKHEDAIKELE